MDIDITLAWHLFDSERPMRQRVHRQAPDARHRLVVVLLAAMDTSMDTALGGDAAAGHLRAGWPLGRPHLPIVDE